MKEPVEDSELFRILTRAWHLNFNGLPAGLVSYDGNLYDHHPWELRRRLSSSSSTTVYILAFKQLGRRKTKDGMRWRQSGGMLESDCGLLRSYFTYRPCDNRIQGLPAADRWNMIEFSLAQHREVKKSRVPVVSIIKNTLTCDSLLQGSRLVLSGISSDETRQSSPSTAVSADELNDSALAEDSDMAIWAELEEEIDFSESLWCGGRCRFEGPIVQESDWNDEHLMGEIF